MKRRSSSLLRRQQIMTRKRIADTSSVETVIDDDALNETAAIIIKSTVPVGFTSRKINTARHVLYSRLSFCARAKRLKIIYIPRVLLWGVIKQPIFLPVFARRDPAGETLFMRSTEAEV